MTRAILVGGPPHPDLALLADELARRPGVARAHFELAAMVERIREATVHRATIWQGVGAGRVEWVEPALRRFAPDIVNLLGQGARDLVLAHADCARRLELLEAALPDAQFILVADVDDTTDARATEFIEPAVRRALRLGARLSVVRAAELASDPDRTLAALVAKLGLAGPRQWQGARPQARSRPGERNLEALALDLAARRAWAALGVELPAPDAALARRPELALTAARSLMAEGDLDSAERALGLAAERAPDAHVFSALGRLRLLQQREDEAVPCLLRALHMDAGCVEAWQALLALPHRAEPLAVIEFARVSPEREVRLALSRFLIARGMDAEAAEVVTATGL